MTRDEIKQLLMRIQTVYPNWKPQTDLRFVVETWNEYLFEYSYEQMLLALKAFISTDTSGFAPNIGQLIEKARMISCPEEMNEMEAWALVSKALRNGYYGAEEEFEKLPPLIQKAVGQPSQLRQWAQTESISIENVVQSNFLRTYRSVVNRSNEVSRMPVEIRKMIEDINPRPMIENQNMSLIQSQETERKTTEMPEGAMDRLKRILSEED